MFSVKERVYYSDYKIDGANEHNSTIASHSKSELSTFNFFFVVLCKWVKNLSIYILFLEQVFLSIYGVCLKDGCDVLRNVDSFVTFFSKQWHSCCYSLS